MSKTLSPSELILNPDGSIYHLNLKPEDVSSLIITVGDPDRVDMVCSFFDQIETSISKREFHTKTGTYKNKRITVISTGIGTDNIDIVLNELDALFNVDFKKRQIKETFTELKIIRIGTSGAMQADIPVDSILLSEYALGLDSLMNFYKRELSLDEKNLESELRKSLPDTISFGYISKASSELLEHFSSLGSRGITVTCPGFYAPQGRSIRLGTKYESMMDSLKSFTHEGKQVTNFEMETSGIYGLASILGHHAISINVILANRANGIFSESPKDSVKKAIKLVLDKISEL